MNIGGKVLKQNVLVYTPHCGVFWQNRDTSLTAFKQLIQLE